MSKWREFYKKTDKFSQIDKIHRKSFKNKKSKSEETDPFEKPEKDWETSTENEVFTARVVEVHKRYAFVSIEKDNGKIDSKDVWLGTVARKYLTKDRQERNFIVVGDRVLCRPAKKDEIQTKEDLPQCVILNMAPRHSKVARRDPVMNDREHVLASNVDQLVVVASYLHPTIKWGLIDRYLVLAEEQQIPAILVFNKCDLLAKCGDENFIKECEEQTALFRSLGYKVFVVSALNDPQTDPDLVGLRDCLHNKMSILSGHSGVGKSSIVNLFKPEITQEVEENPNIFYKGRHTTTYASLISMGIGGYVIDTPGIRSFVMDNFSSIDLSHYFLELRSLRSQCKFRECRHIDEPGCAVLEALEQEKISSRRYRSYVNLLSGESGREGRNRKKDV